MERLRHLAQPAFQATIQVDSHVIKKNRRPIFRNQRTGVPFIGKSQRLRNAEDFLVSELRNRAITSGLHQPIRSTMRCVLQFGFTKDVFYTAKRRESKRLGDCTNLAEIVQDALQKSGVIENDALLNPVTISRVVSDQMQVTVELYG